MEKIRSEAELVQICTHVIYIMWHDIQTVSICPYTLCTAEFVAATPTTRPTDQLNDAVTWKIVNIDSYKLGNCYL